MTAFLVAHTQAMAGLLAGLVIGATVGGMLGWDWGRQHLISHLRTQWRHAERASLVFGYFPPISPDSDDPDDFDNSSNVDSTWGGR